MLELPALEEELLTRVLEAIAALALLRALWTEDEARDALEAMAEDMPVEAAEEAAAMDDDAPVVV